MVLEWVSTAGLHYGWEWMVNVTFGDILCWKSHSAKFLDASRHEEGKELQNEISLEQHSPVETLRLKIMPYWKSRRVF